MPRRRATALAVAIALLLAIAGAWRWQSASGALPGVTKPVRANDEPPRPTPRSIAKQPQAPDATHSPFPEGSLALATAQDLRQRARYPRSSQPLREGEDPIVRDHEVSRNSFPGPNGEDPALTAFPDQINFEHPDPVILYAYLTTGDTRVPARSIDAEVLDDTSQRLARVVFADDGVDPDRKAGDRVYTARLPSADGDRLAGGAYVVRVHALSADGQERTGSTGFLYSRPAAQLTGRYTDALVGGNLELQAEVQIQDSGRFHLEGTLYTPSGTPLAWAQNALSLQPGTQWIPLSFFGLILHERGEDGPYVLRFAALSTTTSMPNAKNRLVENAYVTGPYRAAEFSDHTFDDPHLIDAAQRLERGSAAEPAPDAAANGQDSEDP